MSLKDKVLILIKDNNAIELEKFLKENSFEKVLRIAKEEKLLSELETVVDKLRSRGYIRYMREGEKL